MPKLFYYCSNLERKGNEPYSMKSNIKRWAYFAHMIVYETHNMVRDPKHRGTFHHGNMRYL
jgi:hypothetical protein